MGTLGPLCQPGLSPTPSSGPARLVPSIPKGGLARTWGPCSGPAPCPLQEPRPGCSALGAWQVDLWPPHQTLQQNKVPSLATLSAHRV